MPHHRESMQHNYSQPNIWKFLTTCLGLSISLGWLFIWIAGMVIAKGFWSTTFAVITGGLWSGYLFVEKILIYFRLV